jgi:hypothetical protein
MNPEGKDDMTHQTQILSIAKMLTAGSLIAVLRADVVKRRSLCHSSALLVGLATTWIATDSWADASKHVVLFADDYSELCQAVQSEAESLLEIEGDFCSFPVASSNREIKPIEWRQTDSETARKAWSDFLASEGWDKRIPPREYGSFWKKYETILSGMLKVGDAALETATIDVDNDGSSDRVYRATTIRPKDPNDPGLGWTVARCSLPENPAHPAHTIFFESTDMARMGLLGRSDIGNNAELIEYRGKIYRVGLLADIFSVSQIRRHSSPPYHAFFSQECALSIEH